jgi:hypothetical protein
VKDGDVDLNSYGVDYSAQVTTKNPVLYGIYGIIGGFYGRFSLLPYFLKLREYNDYESRDLWEFELNLTQEQKELFVAHLWDMNLALFDYYYFTENCSYHILRIIDAVVPQYDLSGQVGKIVIPIETIRPLLKTKDLVKSIHLRPSVHKRVKRNIEKLNDKEREYFSNAVSKRKLEQKHNLSEHSYASALDVLIDFVDYKYPKEMHLEKENDIQDFKRELLIARSMIDAKGLESLTKFRKETINIPHGTSYVGAGRVSGSENGQSLSFRSALHNILEPAGDVYADFTLEMNKLELFYDDTTQKLHLDDYTFARVFTLRPLSIIEKKISWDFSFGANENTFNSSHITPYLNVGIGVSFGLGDAIFYTFLQTSFQNGFAQTKYADNSVGPSVGLVYGLGSFRFNLNYKSLYDYANFELSHYKLSLNSLYTFTPDYALEIQSSNDELQNRTGVSFQYKF